MKTSLFFLLSLACLDLPAQRVTLGGISDAPIEVMASSEFDWELSDQVARARSTINGQGLDMKKLEASRFLAQATLGFDEEEIDQVLEQGFESWIDDQFDMEPTPFLNHTRAVFSEIRDFAISQGLDSLDYDRPPYFGEFSSAWWEMIMKAPDLLRHKVAHALSQILVISGDSDLGNQGYGLASYYDIFLRHAGGNYRDILREVSLHPMMGFYLTHFNNPKADPDRNIHPDENYAREFLQLFTIGLYELNADGTRKQDTLGHDIPTYDQRDIKDFARIWTGLGPSAVMANEYDIEPGFGVDFYHTIKTEPMAMYDAFHDDRAKTLLNGYVVAAGNSGLDDIDEAIDHVFAHQNVAPFVSLRLIQRLVKSNPSTDYIERVSTVFDDNGSGVKGDMRAIVKAILLDPEARSCAAISRVDQGMLREPLVRYVHYAKALDTEQFYNRFWNVGYGFWNDVGQAPLGAPSVFNFYFPNYQPNGPLTEARLVGPEFQILNARTSVEFLNHMNGWTLYDYVMESWMEGNPSPYINMDELKKLARDPEVLINRLDLLFTHGQLSDRTREIVRTALEAQMYDDFAEARVELGIYLILSSPDYAILR